MVEPDSMSFADVDDHSRTVREVYTIHKLRTFRTRNVANLARQSFRIHGFDRGRAEYGGLVFGCCANSFERWRVQPQSSTAIAFQHFLVADIRNGQIGPAARTMLPFRRHFSLTRCLSATPGTMLASYEHHREARRTCDCRKNRFTVLALRSVRRCRRATHWAVNGSRFHRP